MNISNPNKIAAPRTVPLYPQVNVKQLYMEQQIQQGIISFVHHDKQYVTIDYVQHGKKKSINSRLDNKEETGKRGKKYKFRVGDEVKFDIKPAERGDRMIAVNLKFLYNTAIEILINKAKVENRFAGFLKQVDDQLYIKERDSYIFFPLKLSKWENPPALSAFNEVISFRLINLDKPHAMTAELFSHDFIPAYRQAMEHFKSKKPTEAVVSKISPFAIYLDLFEGKIQGKLPITGQGNEEIKAGDKLEVKITHLGGDRIVITPVKQGQD